MIYRQEIVSGIFYKSSQRELRNQIKQCFLDKDFGPRNLPKIKKSDEFKAFIIPHAGYDYSGPCAAYAYKSIIENSNPEIIVLLGPNHSGYSTSASVFSKGFWMTPLGKIEVDEEFCEELIRTKLLIPDEISHSQEHSIEVQLPFIKYIYENNTPKIVPILINADINEVEELEKIAKSIFKTWTKSSKRILFIASTDLSHVGRNYGFIPFKEKGTELNDKIKQMDRVLLNHIIKLDTKKATEYAKEKKLTICGMNTIIVLLNILKNMKGKKVQGKVLQNYTSAEIKDNYNNIVNYASIEFNPLK